ncbi:MAG TPA: HAD-IC family P-type ATPase [Gemmatimonadaceae bacterium]
MNVGASPTPPWHARPAHEVLLAVSSNASGLTDEEAARRLVRYGPNLLSVTPAEPAWRILVRQVRSVVIGLLVVATVLAWWTSDVEDAGAILAVLLLNVGIGFATEFRARRAMDALLRLDVPSATVVRQGITRTVDARELVPGDLIELEPGQAIPADARLLAATALQTIEASLTGESTAVAKIADAEVSSATPLPDRVTMVYKGTTVADGVARAVVVATGMQTEVGRIGTLVSAIREEPTVLERRLDSLGRRLAAVAVGVGVLVALVSLYRGDYLVAVLQTGIAVAIAAVPEGLPAVVTITMAIATRRMARRHALVRRLPAVETLGSVTVVCSDKTGTLTAGKQTVTTIWLPKVEVAVTDDGTGGSGAFVAGSEALAADDQWRLREALSIGVLANRAEIRRVNEHWEGRGDPSEVALLLAARKGGLLRPALLQDWPELGEIPFSSARMMMATFHRGKSGDLVGFVKGAHDRVLALCASVVSDAGEVRLDADWQRTIDEQASTMASRGLRVLALAMGAVAEADEAGLRKLRFVGLAGMTDPPAPGVVETIAKLRGAGIRTVMLTGDHRATARAVAQSVGLVPDEHQTLDGRDVDHLSDDELTSGAAAIGVVSRVSPEGKLRIVTALQRRGDIVAMLGDGINDAAALKKADIGVAMGRRGTDAAKEVAGLVLEDDRFQTIASAVEEGRVVFDNIRKFVFYLFSCNVGEILALLGAGLTGLPLPMTPLQILWLNLVTDTFPALALALEPADPAVMRRSPREPGTPLLSGGMLRLGLLYSLLIAGVTIAALVWGLREWPGEAARAVTLSFTTLALAQIFHLGNARSRQHVVGRRLALGNRYALSAVVLTVVLQVLAVVAPPLGRILGTAPLTTRGWMIAIALGAIPGLVGQGWKLSRRRQVVA